MALKGARTTARTATRTSARRRAREISLQAQLAAQHAGQRPARQGRSMDLRTYGIGAQILRDLGVGRMRLMAAPRKMPSMAGFGLEIAGYAERIVK